ncbi:unnamed protein product [Symbiodinium sp. CCMP2456]|nr:unnamed protein product [Symbiodinium sp. CCMP2456]
MPGAAWALMTKDLPTYSASRATAGETEEEKARLAAKAEAARMRRTLDEVPRRADEEKQEAAAAEEVIRELDLYRLRNQFRAQVAATSAPVFDDLEEAEPAPPPPPPPLPPCRHTDAPREGEESHAESDA